MQCMNLKCPNLLTIFDLKTSDAGDTFVVMEYVAGPSLASVLKQYPDGLPLPEVRHWLKGLVEGVAYLHDHGIVHRDLKPANLFMEEGIVKIGDYGLAKLITPSQGTEHSESIGTCHYMAPEIGSGKYHKPIDVYAIGVILYEMLTGRVPFDGETVNEVLMKHLTARPDVSMLPRAVSDDRGQGAGQGPEPAARAGSTTCCLPRMLRARPRSGSSATARPARQRRGRDGAAGRPDPGRRPADRGRGADLLHRPGHPPASGSGLGRDQAAAPGQLGGPAAPGPLSVAASRLRRADQPVPIQGPPPANGAVRQAAYARPVPKQPPRQAAAPPPPEPPPLPSGRVRIAELAASMLWAAPLLALLTIPAAALLGIDPSSNPQQLAYLYGMALLGTWTALVPNKVDRDPPARRHQPAVDRPGGRTARGRDRHSCWRRRCDST